jgi:hypothetical protein
MSDWSGLPEGVSWKSKPLFNFDLDRRSLLTKFGPPHAVNTDSNGVGLFDAWFVRFSCGLEVAIWMFHDRFDGELVRPVERDDDPRNIEVHANEQERSHILFHLGLGVTELHLWEPDTSYVGPAVWRVMRQDDNGNLSTMRTTTSRCEASAIARDFEMRGHKQTYWVEG